jgi:hypothetical protein
MGTSFLYPLKLSETGKIKITPIEKNLIDKAIRAMKTRGLDYFYVTQLTRERTFDSKDIEALYSLIVKKIFDPLP